MMSQPVTSVSVGIIFPASAGGLLRPSQRRERPQRRAEPGVEHVGVAHQFDSSLAVMDARGGLRSSASSSDNATKTWLVRPVPGGNADGPTRAGGETHHGWMFSHPAERRSFSAAASGTNTVTPPIANRSDRRFGRASWPSLQYHCVGQERLDRHAADRSPCGHLRACAARSCRPGPISLELCHDGGLAPPCEVLAFETAHDISPQRPFQFTRREA